MGHHHIGPAGDQNEITQRLSQYKTVVQNQPAINYSSVLSTNSRAGPDYGTVGEYGEPISVKGHLTELEVSSFSLILFVVEQII